MPKSYTDLTVRAILQNKPLSVCMCVSSEDNMRYSQSYDSTGFKNYIHASHICRFYTRKTSLEFAVNKGQA